MSSELTITEKKRTRKSKKKDGVNTSNEKINIQGKKETRKPKLPKPIIYDPNIHHGNILIDGDKKIIDKNTEIINSEAKEITNYYLHLHKNLINTYNRIYSQLIQNNYSLSLGIFFNGGRGFTNYPLDVKNIYTEITNNRDKSLKLIDNIITNNLDTFIKSIELTQKFYQDILQSYFNCINRLR